MKNNKGGFTLIELLVVVLIIGILAAIALPQYRIAVAKSRVANIVVLMKSIYNAKEVYLMNNSELTDIDALDISIPHTSASYDEEHHRIILEGVPGTADGKMVVETRKPNVYAGVAGRCGITIDMTKHSETDETRMYCYVKADSANGGTCGVPVCKSMQGAGGGGYSKDDVMGGYVYRINAL